MTSLADLLVCKDCRNVFTDRIGDVRTSPAKCPACKSTNNEGIHYDI